ncbi:unnamed protein product [Toxocara canis]|uniref:t-SNARE coiled-coil homology domain-containing protein n=1 Tax=Toxocara canis TaxID=6265 RepID=A0A183VCM8_TOXCA|nr:unnamed protein product [Toxocara canis]
MLCIFRTSDNENNVDDDNFDSENLSGSLEDLVGTFDQKISHCFRDLAEDTEQMAPVQVRTQDEIMSESHWRSQAAKRLIAVIHVQCGELQDPCPVW